MSSPQVSLLCNLPPELRRMIFKLALYSKTGEIRITRKQLVLSLVQIDEGPGDLPPEPIDSSVLRVCKLFYNEVKQVLYGDSVFNVRYDDVMLWNGSYNWMSGCIINPGLVEKLCVQFDRWWLLEFEYLLRVSKDNKQRHPAAGLSKIISCFPYLREIRLRRSDDDISAMYASPYVKHAYMPYDVYRETCMAMTAPALVLTLEQTTRIMAHGPGRVTASYPIYVGPQCEYVRLVLDSQCSRLQAGESAAEATVSEATVIQQLRFVLNKKTI